MPARFRILCATETGGFAPALLAASLESHLADLGIEGIDVWVTALSGGVPQATPETVSGLNHLGLDPDMLSLVELTPDLLAGAELVLCGTTVERDRALDLGAGRAYTVMDYLGRPDEPGSAGGLSAGQSGAAAAEALHELARQAAGQIGYELETDPGRPGGMARD